MIDSLHAILVISLIGVIAGWVVSVCDMRRKSERQQSEHEKTEQSLEVKLATVAMKLSDANRKCDSLTRDVRQLQDTISARERKHEMELDQRSAAVDEIVRKLSHVKQYPSRYGTYRIAVDIDAEIMRMSDEDYERRLVAERLSRDVRHQIITMKFVSPSEPGRDPIAREVKWLRQDPVKSCRDISSS